MGAMRHIDKIGIAGSIFAALCCLGVSAVVSIVSAVGLGFLIKDLILRPLLIAFLLLTLGGLALGMRHHHRPWALILAGAASVILFLFTFVTPSRPIAAVGITGLVAASILNVVLGRRSAPPGARASAAPRAP